MDPTKGGVLVGGMTSTSQDGGVTLAWVYRSGDVFFFDLAPGFGTARTPLTDQQFVRDVATIKPVTWDNLGGPQRVDSLVLRLTRFRAMGDLTDVVIGTRLSLQSLAAPSSSSDRAAEGAAATELRVDLRLIDGGAAYSAWTPRGHAPGATAARTAHTAVGYAVSGKARRSCAWKPSTPARAVWPTRWRRSSRRARAASASVTCCS